MSQTPLSDRFATHEASGTRVAIETPEGVPIVLTVATFGERLGAFALDLLLFGSLLFVALMVAGFASLGNAAVGALATLMFFLLRNTWFLAFELRTNGRTPGKRRTRLRVVDARGGPLRPISVVVRNLTREVELFVPLALLASPELLVESESALVRAASALWVLAFWLVPMIDPRHRRAGDLLAGTLVVREPRQRLLADLADAEGLPEASEPRFSAEQLGHYGIYELQVLEGLLRGPAEPIKLAQVAERIIARTGWGGELGSHGARRFLEAFYRAQRGRLEADLALGRARERKVPRPPADR